MHECLDGIVTGSYIEGITSDNIRAENSQRIEICYNKLLAYLGSENNGAYEGGQNFIQAQDQGQSKGYGGHSNPDSTKDINIHDNTFGGPCWHVIWISDNPNNIWIHNNTFLDLPKTQTDGYSVENLPTVEHSEQIFSSIFDILNLNFSDTGRTEQKAEDIQYSLQKTDSGLIAGGIKIIGFKDLINIDNFSYIPDNKSILVKYDASASSSVNWWDAGVSSIEKTVNTKIDNGTAYAELDVTMEYYTVSTNSKTKSITRNYYTTTATFTDSCPAPKVLQRPAETQGHITFYNNSITPHTLVFVPSQGLTMIHFEYLGNYSEHTLMIGERSTGENGVQLTNFSTCEYWKGTMGYQGEALYIPGSVDQSKLNVTCYTPYEAVKITKFQYTEKKLTDESFSDWVFPFLMKLSVILFFLWKLLKIPFS